jgi:hypothetical protein
MGGYFREIAQVCANSVEQVEPDNASDNFTKPWYGNSLTLKSPQ